MTTGRDHPDPAKAPRMKKIATKRRPAAEAAKTANARTGTTRNAVPYITLVQDIVQASFVENCPLRPGCRGKRDLWPLTIPEKTRIKLRGEVP